MKRLFPLLLLLSLIPSLVYASELSAVELPIAAPEALLMEKSTGKVLYAKSEHEIREPASVTKIMTLLLTMEAIDDGRLRYDDMVTVSAYAASMGGSQVYLKEGEQISVEDLLKSVCVASGNDAAVALAEKVSGASELFVEQMNLRAQELGMADTHFLNPTGLPAEGHVTSAYDIALMSRELILQHPDIRRFTTIWMDSIRDGSFQLNNTNKLIRFYDGATGLKTGSTDAAGYCISATAEREGMELIAVIMHGETSQSRNEDAKTLLNYGFSTYALTPLTPELPSLPVHLGAAESVSLSLSGETYLLSNKTAALRQELNLPETVEAPIRQGAPIGSLCVYDGDTLVAELSVTAAAEVPRMRWSQMLLRLLRVAFLSK